MFPTKNLEGKLHVQIATSTTMDNSIELWLNMYENHAPWLGGEAQTRSLNLAAAIAEEMARLTLTEFVFKTEGSPRADFINEQLENCLDNMSNIVEMWCALGGVVLKPYAAGEDENGNPTDICLDVVQANRFYPTAFDSNKRVTGAVFLDTKRVGDYLYTRAEYHNLVGTHYTVVNKAYRSERLNTSTTEDDQVMVKFPFSEEVSLDSAEDWAGIEPIVEMDGIEKPLFVYIKIPRANTIDPHSPLGASVFSRAVEVIEEADKQYSRILWEYEATEAAVDADESIFNTDKHGHAVIPKGSERLFRTYDFEGAGNKGFLQAYSPQIRDSALFSGLNNLFRRIEFLCGLAYGTISDVQAEAKTATEVKTSKQRSYTTVGAMQRAWDRGLEDLVEIMDALCTLYNLTPPGEIQKTATWGDSVLEDMDVEYQRRWSMVMSGKMRIEKFYEWYFGCSEEEALSYIPQAQAYPPEE